MKDSGIEWIGKIPDIWRQTKLKYVTKIRSENGMYSPEQDSYIGLENIVSRSNKLIETETIYESALYSICKKGDILFNKLRPYLAKAIISPIDGFCTGELLNIKHFDGEKRFLWYYLLSDKFIEVVNASTYGAKMPRANTDFILNLPVFLPPLPEQKKIADFLDGKCTDIDQIRADIEKQIEILTDYKKSVITEAVTKGLDPKVKLKDSGIKWVGKIPEHWNVSKMKYACSKITDFTASGSFADLAANVTYLDSPDYAMLIRTADLSKKREVQPIYIDKHAYEYLSNSNLFGGEILLSNIGSVGDVYYFEPLYEKCSLAPNAIMAISKKSSRYLYYFLSMPSATEELRQIGGNAVQQKFNKTQLRQLACIAPPFEEQKAIASCLDEKCSEIDSAIEDKQKQLETLEDYKKSLIFEYVTGKKEVV